MSILEKYIKIARDRTLQRLPLGDICEYCQSSARKENDTCGKCGAPMKPIYGYVAGIPIDAEDVIEVQKHLAMFFQGGVVIK